MAFRVKILNFQSIAEADLEVSGFTVITGPNDVGKSAVIRAIHGLFKNNAGVKDSFRRKGEDQLRVELIFDDLSVSWERTKGVKTKTVYHIGPDRIETGKGPPDELGKVGIKPILAGGKTLWPQIADQFDGQVFLLNQSGSVVAEAVADVETVGRLSKCLKASESDRKAVKGRLKFSREEFSRLTAEILRFEGMDEVQDSIESLEEEVGRARKAHKLWTLFDALRQRLLRVQEVLGGLEGVELISVPSQDVLDRARKLLAGESVLAQLLSRYQDAFELVGSLEGAEFTLSGPDLLQEARSLQQECEALGGLCLRHARSAEAVASFEGLSDVLGRMLWDKGASDEVRGKVARWEALEGLSGRHDRWSREVGRLTSSLEDKENEFKLISDEITAILDSLDRCPVCGTDFEDQNHTHQETP